MGPIFRSSESESTTQPSYCSPDNVLTPKGPTIHGFIYDEHIVKNTLQMRLNSAYVGQNTNKFEQKKVHTEPTKKPIHASWPFRG